MAGNGRMTQWSKNDELFIQQLKIGRKWEEYIAAKLTEHDIEVSLPKFTIRDSIKQTHLYTNSKDIIANNRILEVKSRNLPFKPFPYKDMHLDTVSGWEAKSPKPDFYIMISQIDKTILWTDGTSKKNWKIRSVYDRIRKIRDDFFVVDFNQFKDFDSLVSILKQKSYIV